jgi:polysaccharide biosynthesis/export protein
MVSRGFLFGVLLGLLGLALGGTCGMVRAESEYLVGPEDVLSITVWEHPELSRTVAVRADGNVSLPPLGDVPAAGQSTAAMAREIETRIYNTLRLTTQVTISVASFNSQKVYLAGQVTNPGRYAFETIPNLVDLLGMTGGLSPQADLSKVRILRKAGGETQTLSVDLSAAVQTGDLTGVPGLKTGDLIMIPGSTGGTGQLTGASAVYVLGAVARPGPYNAVAGMNVIQLLSVAGGTTDRADLGQIEVLAAEGTASYRVQVDLNREIEAGRGGLVLRAGDTVVVPSAKAGAAAVTWAVVQQTLATSRDVLNIFLIKNVLK